MKRDEIELLNNAKMLLKDEMSNISFITWINPIEIEEITDTTIVFRLSSPFQKDVIENKYHDLIVNTFKYLTNKDYEISTVCPDELTEKNNISTSSYEKNIPSSSGLNPNYTFDSYVVGNNNRFAQADA